MILSHFLFDHVEVRPYACHTIDPLSLNLLPFFVFFCPLQSLLRAYVSIAIAFFSFIWTEGSGDKKAPLIILRVLAQVGFLEQQTKVYSLKQLWSHVGGEGKHANLVSSNLIRVKLPA